MTPFYKTFIYLIAVGNGLVQVLYATGKAYQFRSFTYKEEANKAVAEVLETTLKTGESRVASLIVCDFTANRLIVPRASPY